MGRSPCCEKEGLNRGAWTPSEDKILIEYIKVHGEGRWRNLPKRAGLKRCGKSCRLRWLNYLRPDIKRGNITPDEEELIIRLHRLLGNRWSLIAGRLPGRTDNEIKNYWNTNLSKRMNQQSEVNTSTTVSKKSQINHKNKRRLSHDQFTKTQVPNVTGLTFRSRISTRDTKLPLTESNVVRTKAIRCTKFVIDKPQHIIAGSINPSSIDPNFKDDSSSPCFNSSTLDNVHMPSELIGNMGDFRMIYSELLNQEFSHKVCDFSYESSNSGNDLSPSLVEHPFVLSKELLDDWLGERPTNLS